MSAKSLLLTIVLCVSAFPTHGKVSLTDWEGIPTEDLPESTENIQKGWVEDTVPVPNDDLNATQNPVTEVVFSPRRQLQTQNVKAHKDSPLTPVSATSAKDIKDETATTGENAKKHMPQTRGYENIQTTNILLANQTAYNLYF